MGIGEAVLNHVLGEANAARVPVTLSCFKSNETALRFYKRHGFRVVLEDEHFVELMSAA
jgi:ribosomal protein S18 acetylase RimI-like enzyme